MTRSYIALIRGMVFLLALMAVPVHAADATCTAIIKKVVDNLNGESAILELTMVVQTKRVTRTLKMESFSIGNDRSFIKMVYPGKDKGITFLKVDKAMWQYVPRIEKTIKIPASMMLQSWMGSDFSNDDLAKESSLDEDYTHTLLAESAEEYRIALHPTPEAAVVWGKIIMAVSKKYYLPTTVQYFAEDGQLIRELFYTDVKPFAGRYYPTSWLMLPREAHKAGHQTRIEITKALFDVEVSESYFTKRALKRYSR